MFKYSLKSMLSRKTVTVLFTLALIIALTVSMVSVNISNQVSEGFIRADSKYDIIIGPNGSDIQLVMSSLFFSELPLGTMPYKYVDELKDRGDLALVVPFAMGDNYKGNNIVGTSPEFLRDTPIAKGGNFKNTLEVVIGHNVARNHNLKLGDKIVSAHGTALDHIGSLACLFHSHSFEDSVYIDTHDDTPYTVVGILGRTNSAFDNMLFTGVESIWQAHRYANAFTQEGDEELVTSILVRSENRQAASQVTSEFNSDARYQAIHPTSTLRKLTQNLDLSKQIAFLLCTIILTLAFIIVCIMTFLMLSTISKEVKTLRFIGLGKGEVFNYVFFQTIVISLFSVVVAIVLSRVTLFLANRLTTTMGIIISYSKFYGTEIGVILIVLGLCIVPTVLYINNVLRKGLANEI